MNYNKDFVIVSADNVEVGRFVSFILIKFNLKSLESPDTTDSRISVFKLMKL